MKKHIVRITGMLALVMSILIPTTLSYSHDREVGEVSQWGTGSLDIEVTSLTSNLSRLAVTDSPQNERSSFMVKNIGSRPFVYRIVGEVTPDPDVNCEGINIEVWKNSSDDTPLFSGKLTALSLAEEQGQAFSLLSEEETQWWYQLIYPDNTHACEVKIMAEAWQGEVLGGFQDVAMITGEKPATYSQILEGAQTEAGATEIYEKVLMNEKGVKVTQLGEFLLSQVLMNDEVTSIKQTFTYTHVKDGETVEEVVTNQIERDAFGEFEMPDVYVGTCTEDEQSCNPHLEVAGLTVTLELLNNQEITDTLTFPLDWQN